jgi:hypothetical protein
MAVETQRLVASLMLLVAASEQVMLESDDEPTLSDLSASAKQLRDLATKELHELHARIGHG